MCIFFMHSCGELEYDCKMMLCPELSLFSVIALGTLSTRKWALEMDKRFLLQAKQQWRRGQWPLSNHCEHATRVPSSENMTSQVKLSPGWIGHCVMYSGPSSHGFLGCFTPCLEGNIVRFC